MATADQEAMDAAIAECHRIAGNNDTENAKFIQCMRTGRGTDILQGRSAAYAEHRKQESFGEAATDDAGAWVWQWKRMLGLDQSR